VNDIQSSDEEVEEYVDEEGINFGDLINDYDSEEEDAMQKETLEENEEYEDPRDGGEERVVTDDENAEEE